jgi:hypothetical protein
MSFGELISDGMTASQDWPGANSQAMTIKRRSSNSP